MAIVWDVGTAISGSSTVLLLGRYARIELTTIPTWVSLSGASPPLYRNLGVAGAVVGTSRQPGTVLQWPVQILGPFDDHADYVWYRLVAGVSGTLYRGVSTMADIGVGCELTNSADQSIANNTPTTITFNTELRDPFGMHSTSSNTGRVTAPAPGWYHVQATVAVDVSTAGIRQLSINRNGSQVRVGPLTSAAGSTGFWVNPSIDAVVWMDAGDYVEVVAFQNSGGALNSKASGNVTPMLTVLAVA